MNLHGRDDCDSTAKGTDLQYSMFYLKDQSNVVKCSVMGGTIYIMLLLEELRMQWQISIHRLYYNLNTVI